MRRLSGAQRLRQVLRKADILNRRDMREWQERGRPWGGCSSDIERDAIIAEFDRVYRMGFEDGRAAIAKQEKGHG